jgi:hypothetical protein
MAGVAAGACGMGGGSGDADGVIVHVHGMLPGAASTDPINQFDLTVTGAENDLSGSGRSFLEFDDPAALVSSASIWSLRGEKRGNRVVLSGIVFLASNPDILGVRTSVELDVRAGTVEWSMGPFLTGPLKSFTFRSGGPVSIAIRDIEVRASAVRDGSAAGADAPMQGGS